MAVTKTTDLDNSVVTRYEKAYYLFAAENPGVWGQFIDWQTPVAEDAGGASSYDFATYGETDLVESALADEDTDITPDSITDGNVTLTPNEYGKTWAITKKLRYQSRTKIPEVLGKLVSKNRVDSIDRILRRGACGHGATRPTLTYHVDLSTAMSSLTAASGADCVTFAFLQELNAQAQALGIEPFGNGQFKAIIHPLLALDIQQLTEFKSLGYYQQGEKDNILGYQSRPFSLAGITFIPSNMGRLYLGAGTAVQTATTLAAAVVKGATTVTVADATGLVAGNYITIGTLETESVNPGSNLEQVLITGVDSTTLTIRGNGVGNDFGLRFNHAAAESVVESYNVAAIPLIGQNSIMGIHGSDTGKYGKAITKTGLDTLDRITYYGWYWYGGVGLIQKHIMLGKTAVSRWTLGYN